MIEARQMWVAHSLCCVISISAARVVPTFPSAVSIFHFDLELKHSIEPTLQLSATFAEQKTIELNGPIDHLYRSPPRTKPQSVTVFIVTNFSPKCRRSHTLRKCCGKTSCTRQTRMKTVILKPAITPSPPTMKKQRCCSTWSR